MGRSRSPRTPPPPRAPDVDPDLPAQLALFGAKILLRRAPANRQTRRRRPRSHDCHTHAVVEAELKGEVLVGLRELEGMAQDAHDRSNLTHPFEPPVLLASDLHYAVDAVEGAACGRGGLHPFILEVRPSADIRRWNLRVLHELAHALLRAWSKRREGRKYTHADVWALALMLACPQRSYRDIAMARHVPAWALRLRGTLARAAAQAA